MNKSFIATTIVALAITPMFAGVITTSTNNSNPYTVQAITSPETLPELANTEVIFNFGTSVVSSISSSIRPADLYTFSTSAYFNSTGQAADSSDDGILSVAGPTTNGYWDIQNNSGGPDLLSMEIIGAVAGSSSGTAFDYSVPASCAANPSQCPVNASALYSSPIQINGQPPNNQYFGDFLLTFASPLADQGEFNFQMSSAYITGPISAGSAAPEPASVTMALGGLLCLGGLLRRRSAQARK